MSLERERPGSSYLHSPCLVFPVFVFSGSFMVLFQPWGTMDGQVNTPTTEDPEL